MLRKDQKASFRQLGNLMFEGIVNISQARRKIERAWSLNSVYSQNIKYQYLRYFGSVFNYFHLSLQESNWRERSEGKMHIELFHTSQHLFRSSQSLFLPIKSPRNSLQASNPFLSQTGIPPQASRD